MKGNLFEEIGKQLRHLREVEKIHKIDAQSKHPKGRSEEEKQIREEEYQLIKRKIAVFEKFRDDFAAMENEAEALQNRRTTAIHKAMEGRS